ncbi:MAG: hypothetical protein MZU84_03800 [Sphingobacterium sp.]|nr:hypothetical protein [Sphingobacterium sp.]
MCTFEIDEKRAPNKVIATEVFVALTKIHNLVLIDNDAKEPDRFLTLEEIKEVLNLCHAKSKLTYEQIRKALAIPDNYIFKGVNYKKDADKAEKTVFYEMKGYQKIRKAVESSIGKDYWNVIKDDKDLLNTIARAITFEKSDESIQKRLFRRKSFRRFS